MTLHVKTVTVVYGEQEPFDAKLRKTIQGIQHIKDIKYSMSMIGNKNHIQSALIIYEAE